MQILNKQRRLNSNAPIGIGWRRRSAVVVSVLLSSAPASADDLDTAYFLAMQPYAVLKRASVACGKPIEEHVAYKQRMLDILSGVPDIDIRAASRDIEQAYQTDAHLGGLDCTDGLQDRYKQVIERGVDRDLEYLAEEVLNRQRRNQ